MASCFSYSAMKLLPRVKRIVQKLNERYRKAPTASVETAFTNVLPPEFTGFSGAASFQMLASLARVEAGKLFGTRFTDWLARTEAGIREKKLGREERRAAIRPAILALREAIRNTELILESHFLDLSTRLNNHKQRLLANPNERKGYMEWYLKKIGSGAGWNEIRRHFPFPDFVRYTEAELKEMSTEEKLALKARLHKLNRPLHGNERPVHEAWIVEYDDVERVISALNHMKTTYKKLSELAEGID